MVRGATVRPVRFVRLVRPIRRIRLIRPINWPAKAPRKTRAMTLPEKLPIRPDPIFLTLLALSARRGRNVVISIAGYCRVICSNEERLILYSLDKITGASADSTLSIKRRQSSSLVFSGQSPRCIDTGRTWDGFCADLTRAKGFGIFYLYDYLDQMRPPGSGYSENKARVINTYLHPDEGCESSERSAELPPPAPLRICISSLQ